MVIFFEETTCLDFDNLVSRRCNFSLYQHVIEHLMLVEGLEWQ